METDQQTANANTPADAEASKDLTYIRSDGTVETALNPADAIRRCPFLASLPVEMAEVYVATVAEAAHTSHDAGLEPKEITREREDAGTKPEPRDTAQPRSRQPRALEPDEAASTAEPEPAASQIAPRQEAVIQAEKTKARYAEQDTQAQAWIEQDARRLNNEAQADASVRPAHPQPKGQESPEASASETFIPPKGAGDKAVPRAAHRQEQEIPAAIGIPHTDGVTEVAQQSRPAEAREIEIEVETAPLAETEVSEPLEAAPESGIDDVLEHRQKAEQDGMQSVEPAESLMDPYVLEPGFTAGSITDTAAATEPEPAPDIRSFTQELNDALVDDEAMAQPSRAAALPEPASAPRVNSAKETAALVRLTEGNDSPSAKQEHMQPSTALKDAVERLDRIIKPAESADAPAELPELTEQVVEDIITVLAYLGHEEPRKTLIAYAKTHGMAELFAELGQILPDFSKRIDYQQHLLQALARAQTRSDRRQAIAQALSSVLLGNSRLAVQAA